MSTIITKRQFPRYHKYEKLNIALDDVKPESLQKGVLRKMPYLVDLDEVRGSAVMGHLTGILVQLVPTLFLLLFSLVGTVGVFRLNARRRVREYALRVAVGCPRRRVFREMLAESLLVTAFALVPGLIVSLWVYGNTAVEWLGVWLAVGVMLLFSFLGALQPALTVKRLEITKALNDE